MIGERRTENTGRSGGGAAEKTTMRIFSKSRDRIAGKPACDQFRSLSDFPGAAPEEPMNVPFAVRGRSVHGPHCRSDSSWIPSSWSPPPHRPSSRDGMHLPSFAVSTARRPPSPRQRTYCAPPPSITGRNAARHKAHRIVLNRGFIIFLFELPKVRHLLIIRWMEYIDSRLYSQARWGAPKAIRQDIAGRPIWPRASGIGARVSIDLGFLIQESRRLPCV